jgi:hypothetical protein
MAPDDDDNITVAEARAALAHDMGTAAARLQEILGRHADRPISSLPRWEREEVLAIQRMIREWHDGLRRS